MSSFKDRLAKAKSLPRPTRDVTVAFDSELSEARNELLDLIDQERARPIDARLSQMSRLDELQAKLAEIEDLNAEDMVTIRIVRASGDLWSQISARYPQISAPAWGSGTAWT